MHKVLLALHSQNAVRFSESLHTMYGINIHALQKLTVKTAAYIKDLLKI